MGMFAQVCRRICAKHRHFLDPNFINHSRRNICEHNAANVDLWGEYNRAKQAVEAQSLPMSEDPTRIFANNELNLHDIEVYGFDYDYTLASYKDNLHYLIYNMGRDALVDKHNYPTALREVDYNPGFAVRGLHCDVQKGLLLKIDAFHNIQMGSVYRGLKPVPDKEVKQIYNGTHVAIERMSSFHGKGQSMHQLMDLFAVPEMTLFADTMEYFINHNIPYDAEYVFYDVRNAVQSLHSSGLLHNCIMENTEEYIQSGAEVCQMLKRLSNAGKKLFLITNSGHKFVDKGMKYMVGNDWIDLFDVIITNARKPKFFYDTTRPFRMYDHKLGIKSWDKVYSLQKGSFYEEGNLYQFEELTGWYGPKVLYFGDHVYSDLADATMRHGWRTGAIIPELEDELRIMNTPVYMSTIRWLVALEELMQRMQVHTDPESQQTIQKWLHERNELRNMAKSMFNPQFGSLFRTYHNQTYFTRRLNRFADVYMSSVVNLLQYPLSYTFYPRRSYMPHEQNLESNHPSDTSDSISQE